MVVKLNIPATLVLAPRFKSAFVVERFTLPPLLAALRFNPSESVSTKSPAPFKARLKSVKLVDQLRAEAALRRVISALVAPRVIVRSVSVKSLAFIVNPAD